MGIFDFLDNLAGYEDRAQPATRMNKRHRLLIEPHRPDIAGARVLDLGAHDGRWAYALAEAGAESVTAVEPRAALKARYADFPDAPWKDRVQFRHQTLFEAMDQDIAAGVTYDVIAVLGLLYHIMDHVRLMDQLRQLKPKLVLIDSEFMLRPNPMIQLTREKTHKDLNAFPAFPEQEVTVIGVPSKMALDLMAEAYGFRTEWIDAESMFDTDRVGMQDYFREGIKRRAACRLRPA